MNIKIELMITRFMPPVLMEFEKKRRNFLFQRMNSNASENEYF